MPGTVYLDHAATSPMRAVAIEAYARAAAVAGNASAGHAAGRAARRVVEDARESVAASLGCEPSEVVLTAGGTEADNLGVVGLHRARRASDPDRRRVLVSAVEHPAVGAAADGLAATDGAVVERVAADRRGAVDGAALGAALAAGPERVSLVACMWANNEVGTVQPVAGVVDAARAHGVPVHVDAVQAVPGLAVDLAALGADTVAVSGHKVGGPVRSGALVVRRGTALAPLLHGGGQERGLRPGTLDPAASAAFAAALAETVADRPTEAPRLAALRDRLLAGVVDRVPDAVVTVGDGHRLPGIAHLTFPGCDGESLQFLLDSRGIAASAASACSAGVLRPSAVLLAMGIPADRARTSVRFSLGHTTTDADVDAVLAVVAEVVADARRVAQAMGARPTGPPSGRAA
ncbi:MAG: cysteine desulfurase family protein [Kineosporiaceae bacterium]